MYTYRNIQYSFKDNHFIHFRDPKGGHFHETNQYGRTTLVRSFPDGCRLTPHDFAKQVIDTLYDRQKAYEKEEMKLFYTARSNRNLKNLCS